MPPITVRTIVNAPLDTVWKAWTEPKHIIGWAFASDDWEAPAAENDVQVGGHFKTTMAAKDKSVQFDFTGIYTSVKEKSLIEYDMEDGRHAKIEFIQNSEGVELIETFDPEALNSEELQLAGWQAILDNFKKYTEKLNSLNK